MLPLQDLQKRLRDEQRARVDALVPLGKSDFYRLFSAAIKPHLRHDDTPACMGGDWQLYLHNRNMFYEDSLAAFHILKPTAHEIQEASKNAHLLRSGGAGLFLSAAMNASPDHDFVLKHAPSETDMI